MTPAEREHRRAPIAAFERRQEEHDARMAALRADFRRRRREIDRRILLAVLKSVVALGFLVWYAYELAVALRPLARVLGWV